MGAEHLPKTRFPDDDGFDAPAEPGDGIDAEGTSVSAPDDDEPEGT
jgi:hypothetical protein